MEQGDFESLVSRMEQLAREKPVLYRRRVFLLAALGYAYLMVVVLVLLGLTAAAIASVATIGILGGKLTAIVGVLLIAVVRGLWVGLKPPSGEVLECRRSGAVSLAQRVAGKIEDGTDPCRSDHPSL